MPFEGDTTVSVALQHIQDEIVSPRQYVPEIPVSVEKIVLKCTQKRTERRYQNMTDLIADLKRSLVTPDEDFVPMGTDIKKEIASRKLHSEFKKKDLGNLIAAIFAKYKNGNGFVDSDTPRTSDVLDSLKDLGYQYSMIAGMTVALSDISVAPHKDEMVAEGRKKADVLNHLRDRGLLTPQEWEAQFQVVWNDVKEQVGDSLMKSLPRMSPINMMAVSGARGNKNHFTQLAGMRGLMAQKSFLSKENNFAVTDEKDMVLIGYLAFLDPPKESAAQAIKQLHEYGVEVKVLSGDNDAVVRAISRQVGINTTAAITSPELELLNGNDKMNTVLNCNIFSKLTPMQKAEIIQLLQADNNTVGFLGDGINDAAALRESDIGISVDSAVDIAKESADIILLEKDLMVLENGVLEGRKTFGNIVKYVKMTASSNFGNMFSVLAASAFLPFLPMLPIHLLIQNLLYDISQTAIPFDRMDREYLQKPRVWDSADLSRFMIWIGPISSIFDIVTYIVMWWVFKCQGPETEALFQSGWFVEGLLSQTLIVHMIRTRKVPFAQSVASWSVMLMTFAIMAIGICIPFTPFGTSIGLTPLPLSYFPWLIGILLSYCVLTQWLKMKYISVFKRWL